MTRRSLASGNQVVSPEGLSDGVRYAQEFMQRWQNRLTLSRPALVERYRKGELVLLARFVLGQASISARKSREFLAVFYEGKFDNVHLVAKKTPFSPIASTSKNVPPMKGGDDENGYFMFVYSTHL